MTSAVRTRERKPGKTVLSRSMVKTLWRTHLYNTLRKPELLKSIEIIGDCPRFHTTTWHEYWSDVPEIYRESVYRLKKTWNIYIASRFDPSYSKSYSDAYLELIRSVAKQELSREQCNRAFLGKVLGFENFVLKLDSVAEPFAAATTSFRNPIFLSFCNKGIRKHIYSDASLLPLVIGNHEGSSQIYYHYRKQRILKNADETLLFFLAVDHTIRAQSFRGLEVLTDILLSEWDTHVGQRARLLAHKIIIPLMKKNCVMQKRRRALRILDIGSGVGLLTSKVVAKIVESGVLGTRKIEVSLLDLLRGDPKKNFRACILLPGLSKVEHISSDYLTWLSRSNRNSPGSFDITFLFLMLHNMSTFHIGTAPLGAVENSFPEDRYQVFSYLSDYYRAISNLFPTMTDQTSEKTSEQSIFFPRRIFSPSSLVTPDGNSLIRRLMELSDGILIEDGDLLPDELIKHLSQHGGDNLSVFDLSRMLRLSVNHIYWITSSQNDSPQGGEKIWPR